MKNKNKMLQYINEKRFFSITAFMAEFKLSYAEAVNFLYDYKVQGNVKQLNDFKYQLMRSIPIENNKEEKKSDKSGLTASNSSMDGIFGTMMLDEEEFTNNEDDGDNDNSDDNQASIEDILKELEEDALEEEKSLKILRNEIEKNYSKFKCLRIVTKIASISPTITRQEAISKAEEIRTMLEFLEDSEMVSVMDKVIYELNDIDDDDFEELKKGVDDDES